MGDFRVELAALIDRAEREGKWLWSADLWFSPADLRRCNANGRFVWGVVNWKLRDPRDRVEEAKRTARNAALYAEQVRKEMTEGAWPSG